MAAIIALGPTDTESDEGVKQWSAMETRRALKERLANYKIPQVVRVIQPAEGGLPRNAMGKGKASKDTEVQFKSSSNRQP